MKSSVYLRLLYIILSSILIAIFFSPLSVLAKESTPAKAYISGVRGHAQKFLLSCESRSAVDWAAYWGVSISEKKFLNNLPRSDDPEKGFVGRAGDPLGQIPPNSYGVHAGPVAELLRKFGLDAQAQRDFTWDQLKAEIAANRPVIVWVIGEMWPGRPVEYTASDGQTTIVASFEHTMLLVGYSPKSVSAIDATTGQEQSYPLQSFLSSWEVLGRQAVTGGVSQAVPPATPTAEITTTPLVIETTPTPVPTEITSTPIPAETAAAATEADRAGTVNQFYVVRRGEYLTGIARKLGINWRTLAQLNNLYPPYVLYTGQRLRLPK